MIRKEVVACQFDDITGSFNKNLILIKKVDKVGLYDIMRQSIIIPTKYNQIIKKSGKGGYIGIADKFFDNIILGNKTTFNIINFFKNLLSYYWQIKGY